MFSRKARNFARYRSAQSQAIHDLRRVDHSGAGHYLQRTVPVFFLHEQASYRGASQVARDRDRTHTRPPVLAGPALVLVTSMRAVAAVQRTRAAAL